MILLKSNKYKFKMLKIALIFILQFLFIMSPLIGVHAEDYYSVKFPDGREIKAEIAADKAKGLQDREHLCADCGMIFIFDKSGMYSFWMKDTLIPLTLIWIDDKGSVVHIVRDAKPCEYTDDPYMQCELYYPARPSRYVLEINPDADTGIEVDSVLKLSQAH